jgi:hypothetical protein
MDQILTHTILPRLYITITTTPTCTTIPTISTTRWTGLYYHANPCFRYKARK